MSPLRYVFHILFVTILGSVLLIVQAHARQVHASEKPNTTSTISPSRIGFAEPSISFVANHGQIVDDGGQRRADILFSINSRNAWLYFFKGRISYVFNKWEGSAQSNHDGCGMHKDENSDRTVTMYRTDMELVGANPNVVVEAEGKGSQHSNFYYAHCPDGITNVPSFHTLVYRNIYPKIDMVIRTTDAGIKSEFVVYPGGRVADIRMQFVAADSISLTNDSHLRVATPLGELDETAPYSYQTTGIGTREVESHYRISGNIVTFDVADYDHSQTLVIDPDRKWATYYGGSSMDNLNGGDPTEVDRSGNVLITGWTMSNPFPRTTGTTQYTQTFGGGVSFGDAFVVKFGPRGGRLWATYYGGNSDEISHGISSDANRNVFITGHTGGGLPVSAGAFQTTFGGGGRDAFAVKFDSNGARLWGTYIGGSNWDDGYGFGVDSTGNVAVLVTTGSTGMQTTGMTSKPTGAGNNSASYDILMVKLSPAGARVWSTYLGGNGIEYGYAAASDIDDNIIVTGWTSSTNFPITSGAFQTSNNGSNDAFVTKFNSAGTIQFSTYYGGTGVENTPNGLVAFCGIATDGGKNIFITGQTTGAFPVTTGAFQATFGGGSSDAFIVKFNPTGNRLWSTYFGGNAADAGVGCASNPAGSVLVTGLTASNNLPVTADAYQATLAGGTDAFIVKLDSNGTSEWVTYYGGSGADEGHGISFDPYGSMVVAGHTSSTNFPVLSPYQATNAGQDDAFALVFCDMPAPHIDSTGPLRFCWTDSVGLFVESGFAEYLWSNGDTSAHTSVRKSGDYFVRVTNSNGCQAWSDTVHVLVLPKPDPYIFPGYDQSLCQGDTVTLEVRPKPYVRYRWSTGDTTRSIKVFQTGMFRAIIVDSDGCIDTTAWVNITVNPRPPLATVEITPKNPDPFCEGGFVTLTASDATGLRYLWNTGARTKSILASQSGTYTVKITNEFDCPAGSDSVVVRVWAKPMPQILPQSSTTFCVGDSVVLKTSSGYIRYEWSTGDTVGTITVHEAGTYRLTVTDSNGCVGSSLVTINVTYPPHPIISRSRPAVLCEGDSISLDPGPGYQAYLWSTGETTQTIVVRESGSYSVEVDPGLGCKGRSDTVTVTVRSKPEVTLNGPVEVCANSLEEYSVPPQAGVKYSWSVTGAGGSIVSGVGTATIGVQWGATGTGTVKVTVTVDSSGCSATEELTVVIGSRLVPRVTPNRSLSLCDGDSVTLDAGNYSTYEWSTGEITRRITVRNAGSYWVKVANSTGCEGTSVPVNVIQNTAPTPVITGATTSICQGDSVILGVGLYTKYSWSSGQITRNIIVRDSGTFTCTVTDANGCIGTSQSLTVTIKPRPHPVISGPSFVCLNLTAQYSTPLVATSKYFWKVSGGGGVILSGQNTNVVTIAWNSTGSGIVELDETSGINGCVGLSEPLLISIGSSFKPRITPRDSVAVCQGESAVLSAPVGQKSYLWSTGETTSSITVSTPGVYRVTVTDLGGCVGEDSVTLVPRRLPFPFITPGGEIAFCPGDSVDLEAAAGYVTYLWSNGATTRRITVHVPGDYSVTAINEDGCRGTSEVVSVREYPAPAIPVISAQFETLMSTPAATYQWYFEGAPIPGAISQTHIAEKPGRYTVSIIDANGCSATSLPYDEMDALAVIELAEYNATPGQHLSIPITLSSSRNLDNSNANEFTVTVRFRKNLLFPTASAPMGIVDGEDRVIQVTGSRPQGMSAGTIGVINLIAALGDTLVTPLAIDSVVWSVDNIATTWRNGAVNIMPKGGWKLYLPDGRLSLLAPRPNPAVGPTEVTYEVIEPGRTTLTIVDLIGRRVMSLVDQEVDPGRYTIMFNPAVVASGAYFLVLQTPTGYVVQPMQIEH